MFSKILIPVSSEYTAMGPARRAADLASKFKSEVKLIYITEEKVLNTIDRVSEGMITYQEREAAKKEIVEKHGERAKMVVLKEMEELFKQKGIKTKKKVVHGEFTAVVKKEADREKSSMVIMGFKRGCLLNYRLFNEINIPIWIEAKGEQERILAVCSNLTPNKKVPDVSVNLAKLLNYELYMLYVIDTKDKVRVDENLNISQKKPIDSLTTVGQKFVEKIKKKGIKAELVAGSYEKEVIDTAERIRAGLIIIGRGQKRKKLLGLACRDIKKNMAERSKHSLLFIN
jgi:nucleotide-binding universal stress UspA family protein